MFNLKDNPKLTVLLVIFAISGAIVANPSTIAFLPDKIEGYVQGLAGLIATVSAILGFSATPAPKAKEIKENENEK